MCMISVIHDYSRREVPANAWNRDSYADLQEILRRVAELDRKLGEPNCVDPAKAAWMEAVEKRLAALEK